MPLSPVFRRVLIEVVTTEDLITLESREAILEQLADGPGNQKTELVRMQVVSRQNSLEQIVWELPDTVEPVYPEEHDGSETVVPRTHQYLIQSACIALGMPPEAVHYQHLRK